MDTGSNPGGPAELRLAESNVMGSAQGDGCLAESNRARSAIVKLVRVRGSRSSDPGSSPGGGMLLCSPVDTSWWPQTRWGRARTLVGQAQRRCAESKVIGLALRNGCLAKRKRKIGYSLAG